MSKERVALVIPPSPFLTDERVFPSLGTLNVAASLEQENHPVDVLDLSGIENIEDVVDSYFSGREVPYIGITATTPQFPEAVKLAEVIRRKSPYTRIILGGPHATMVNSAKKLDDLRGVEGRGTKAYEQMVDTFDVCVAGDGERAIFEAIRDDAPKVIDAGERTSPMFIQKNEISNQPFPARHLIDLDTYHYEIDGVDAQSMISQLGCPFKCGFCGGRNTPSFRIARMRSIDSVLEEVDMMVGQYGYKGLMFYDDELNVSNKHLMELMGGLVDYQEKNGVELRLRGFVKAELFTKEQAEIMYRAGFRVILSGVESGDDGILHTMQKNTTREVNSRWVKLCREAGLKSKALMSIGHPGETETTIKNSLKWVLENRPDDVDWTIITQYPGSPYFDQSVPHPTESGVWVYTEPRTGNILYSQDMDYAEKAGYYKGVPGDYTSYVWTDNLSPQELVIYRDWCENISRKYLNLPTIQSVATRQFEHSMGQRELPKSILRSTFERDKIKA